MDLILATFFREHKHHDAWWYRVKSNPKVPTINTNDPLLPVEECPGVFSLSKLLGRSMKDLWEVLIDCNCAKQKGKRGNILDKDSIRLFITSHNLEDVVELGEREKQSVIRIGIYTPSTTPLDHSATLQWRSKKATATS